MQNEGKVEPSNVNTYTPNIDSGASDRLQDQQSDRKPEDDIPLPPSEPKPAPIEEPGPEKPAIGEDSDPVKRIVDAF